jgi:hypothetical protein
MYTQNMTKRRMKIWIMLNNIVIIVPTTTTEIVAIPYITT